MSGQHTPGPWVIDSGTIKGQRDASGYTQSVASIYGPDGEAWDAETSCRANARLIAAAPDLARALADLLADAVEMGLDDSPVSGSLIAARAALQKAGVA